MLLPEVVDFFPQQFVLTAVEVIVVEFEGVLINELSLFLLAGDDVLVDFLDFFFEIIDLAPNHRQFLLDPVLVVGVNQFLVLLPCFILTG